MEDYLERIKTLENGDTESLMALVLEIEHDEELEYKNFLKVFDKLLDLVDLKKSPYVSPNGTIFSLRSKVFTLDDDIFEPKSELKTELHSLKNKQKFILMVASDDENKYHRSVVDLLATYMDTSYGSDVLAGLAMHCTSRLYGIPESLFQHWLNHRDKYFFGDSNCEPRVFTNSEGEFLWVPQACDKLLDQHNHKDPELLKSLYPTFGTVTRTYGDYSYSFDRWISKKWSKKWLLEYYNLRSSFDHIPNEDIYKLLIEDDTGKVNQSVKIALTGEYAKKKMKVKKERLRVAKEIEGAHLGIPDILPNNVKKVILKKMIEQNYNNWRRYLCVFHGDEDGEGDKFVDDLLYKMIENKPDIITKKRKPSFKDDKGKTKFPKTGSEVDNHFTTEQKKAVKKLAKKYQEIFDSLIITK
jgi:hypothetical protein